MIGEEGNQKQRTKARAKPDISSLYLKAKDMRWILVDEISTVSGELAGDLNMNLRQAIRQEHTYSLRGRQERTDADPSRHSEDEDAEIGKGDDELLDDVPSLMIASQFGVPAIDPRGSLRRTKRPFGGVNLLMFGDFWQ